MATVTGREDRVVPAKPGGFILLLPGVVGLVLASPILLVVFVRFGLPSDPCPSRECEIADAARLASFVQAAIPGILLVGLVATLWLGTDAGVATAQRMAGYSIQVAL